MSPLLPPPAGLAMLVEGKPADSLTHPATWEKFLTFLSCMHCPVQKAMSLPYFPPRFPWTPSFALISYCVALSYFSGKMYIVF